MASIGLTNIGRLVSGDIARPPLDATTIVVEEGRITAIGGEGELKGRALDQVYDVGGMTVTPGLIDAHAHPVLGDFTPRQRMLDFIESSLHGGVTTMISAGEAHTPGRPRDPVGVKALAVLAHKAFASHRPGGVKVHGGAVILEPGLREEDFREMAAAGVWLVGEVGLGGVKDPAEAAPMVAWARAAGMKVKMHTGGASIPGSSTVTARDVMLVNPDVAAHINGGPTAVAPAEVETLIRESDVGLEIVQCGNPRVLDLAVREAARAGALARVHIGNDAPSGTGVIPLGIIRTVVQVSSCSGIAAEAALAMATGNTARIYGLPTGIIEVGREGDLVVMDAPLGSVGEDALSAMAAGDIPGIALVVIDGRVMAEKSRNTPPAMRQVKRL